jgi:hypothetical protein
MATAAAVIAAATTAATTAFATAAVVDTDYIEFHANAAHLSFYTLPRASRSVAVAVVVAHVVASCAA